VAHAKLSPSSAHRWIRCTASPKAEEGFPDQSSSFAEEGTYAHAVAANLINESLGNPIEPLPESPYDSHEVRECGVVFRDVVLNAYEEMKRQDPATIIKIEQRLELTNWIREGYGTADALVVNGRKARAFDYKFGKGQRVLAYENEQLKSYCLGIEQELGSLFDHDTYELTIVQPRLDHIDTFTISRSKLLHWAETELKPAAEKAFNGTGDFVPGDHCRWCRARHTCRARAEDSLAFETFDFKSPDLLTNAEVGELLGRASRVAAWASDVSDYAFTQALAGHQWPGWKLVRGRSVRRYSDVDAVAAKLIASGLDEATIYQRSLLGITAMEKALGKKAFAELLGDLVHKPEGAPALVPEADSRPPIELTSFQELNP
jgi:hypothetical protein